MSYITGDNYRHTRTISLHNANTDNDSSLVGLHGISHFHPDQFLKKDSIKRGDGP